MQWLSSHDNIMFQFKSVNDIISNKSDFLGFLIGSYVIVHLSYIINTLNSVCWLHSDKYFHVPYCHECCSLLNIFNDLLLLAKCAVYNKKHCVKYCIPHCIVLNLMNEPEYLYNI